MRYERTRIPPLASWVMAYWFPSASPIVQSPWSCHETRQNTTGVEPIWYADVVQHMFGQITGGYRGIG